MIWTGCGFISAIQFYADLSFDYCTRKDLGLDPYQLTVCVVFVLFPLTVTLFCYVRTGYQVRKQVSPTASDSKLSSGWIAG